MGASGVSSARPAATPDCTTASCSVSSVAEWLPAAYSTISATAESMQLSPAVEAMACSHSTAPFESLPLGTSDRTAASMAAAPCASQAASVALSCTAATTLASAASRGCGRGRGDAPGDLPGVPPSRPPYGTGRTPCSRRLARARRRAELAGVSGAEAWPLACREPLTPPRLEAGVATPGS